MISVDPIIRAILEDELESQMDNRVVWESAIERGKREGIDPKILDRYEQWHALAVCRTVAIREHLGLDKPSQPAPPSTSKEK